MEGVDTMPNAVLTRLADERAGLVEFIDTTLAKANDDGRDLVDAELRNMATTKERIAAIDAQMKPIAEFEETRASAVHIDRLTVPSAPARTESRAYAAPVTDSFGTLVTSADEFRAWQNGQSARMEIPFNIAELRATVVTSADPGKSMLPAAQKWSGPAPAVVTPLLNAITHVPVSTGSVDVVTYGTTATGAAVVAENALKPEATLTATTVPTPLETIAAWVEVTRQLLQDAPAARAIIDSQLTRGVARALEARVAAVIAAGVTASLTGPTGGGLIAAVRAGAAAVQANGWTPDVVLASPGALATMDIAVYQTTALGGTNVQSAYWGLTPVPVPGLADVYVMDASASVFLFERMSIDVFMTDSDVSTGGTSGFRKNLFTILAETRAVAAVVNPTAATKVVSGALSAAEASASKAK